MKTTFGADSGFGDVTQLFGFFLTLFLSSLCVFGSLLIDLTPSFFFDIDVDLLPIARSVHAKKPRGLFLLIVIF